MMKTKVTSIVTVELVGKINKIVTKGSELYIVKYLTFWVEG